MNNETTTKEKVKGEAEVKERDILSLRVFAYGWGATVEWWGEQLMVPGWFLEQIKRKVFFELQINVGRVDQGDHLPVSFLYHNSFL